MAIIVPKDGDQISASVFGKPVADEINRITPITTVTAWTNLTFLNGASAYLQAQYRKVGDIVYLRGYIVIGTAGTLTVATLPAGYRPPQQVQFVCMHWLSGGTLNAFNIDASGNIQPNASMPATASFSIANGIFSTIA